MRKYCDDCGTKMSGGICSNCSEELYIYNNQILVDDETYKISDDFIAKVKEQQKRIKRNCEDN